MAPFEIYGPPPASISFPSPVLFISRHQDVLPVPRVAPGAGDSGEPLYGFENMLDDFGKLRIECPEPVPEPSKWGTAKYPPGLGISLALRERCPLGAIEKEQDWWGFDNRVRSEGYPGLGADTKRGATAFNTTAQIEDYEARRRAVGAMFGGLVNLSASAQEYSQNTEPIDMESDSSSSGEYSDTSPDESDCSEVLTLCSKPFSNDECLEQESEKSQIPPHHSKFFLDTEPLYQDLPAEKLAYKATSGPFREILTKRDGSRFIVTGMHFFKECEPDSQRHIAKLSFGTFSIKKLKSILRNKLKRNVPLDCISFTGHAQYRAHQKRMASYNLSSIQKERYAESSDNALQCYSRVKMTPEDWHHILMTCGDDDWEDFDQLWRDYVPTVSSDFLCSICEHGIPRPQHKRVAELRRD